MEPAIGHLPDSHAPPGGNAIARKAPPAGPTPLKNNVPAAPVSRARLAPLRFGRGRHAPAALHPGAGFQKISPRLRGYGRPPGAIVCPGRRRHRIPVARRPGGGLSRRPGRLPVLHRHHPAIDPAVLVHLRRGVIRYYDGPLPGCDVLPAPSRAILESEKKYCITWQLSRPAGEAGSRLLQKPWTLPPTKRPLPCTPSATRPPRRVLPTWWPGCATVRTLPAASGRTCAPTSRRRRGPAHGSILSWHPARRNDGSPVPRPGLRALRQPGKPAQAV
jgi:hypothetical protein